MTSRRRDSPSMHKTMFKVEVFPHNADWRDKFREEAKHVGAALGENVVVHHIGSTSIPGIYAKPVIDILVEVKKISDVDARSSAMKSLGYAVMGQFGITGRRYFRGDDCEGIRTHQIHAFETGSAEVIRHLAFRNYLIAHPDDALEYSDLKRQLAAEHPFDADAYMDGKDAFINDTDCRAAKWRETE